MATLKNTTIRLFHLPIHSQGDESFGERAMLQAGGSLEVPDWYLEKLQAEKNSKGKPTGWALRLRATKHGAEVKGPQGAAGAFEARIHAYRQAAAEAKEAERAAGKETEDLKRRLSALEAELAAARKTPTKKGAAKETPTKGAARD